MEDVLLLIFVMAFVVIFYVIIPQTPIACQGFFFCWKMRKEDFQMDRVRFGQILAYGVEKIKNICKRR